MTIGRAVLFNHIPKTGGVTLRIILNRVFGEKNIFLIKSTDVGFSLDQFARLTQEGRNQFRVIAGHGAGLFSSFIEKPFRITILREPVTLFLSQYYFLKQDQSSVFFKEVRSLSSLDEYISYAITNGQDNLMTRYLSDSVRFLADPSAPIPQMTEQGTRLLGLALQALEDYDAVLDLADFDAGVYALAQKLGWKRIPIYRPMNINRHKPARYEMAPSLKERLHEVLQYDIALYREFKAMNLGAGCGVDRHSLAYRLFRLRQKGIIRAAALLNKD